PSIQTVSEKHKEPQLQTALSAPLTTKIILSHSRRRPPPSSSPRAAGPKINWALLSPPPTPTWQSCESRRGPATRSIKLPSRRGPRALPPILGTAGTRPKRASRRNPGVQPPRRALDIG